MLKIKEIQVPGYEKVVEAKDDEAGLFAYIAIHNTTLGPALGGVRIYPYKKHQEALEDVLRLAKGMTYKSAMVENGLGGGKSVIIADPKEEKTEKLLLSFGQAVDSFKGRYVVAEDLGTSIEDMLIIRKSTPFVSALPTEKSSGDPSRFTAWGMQAVANHLFINSSLKGKRIAIQGIGSVGRRLANLLFWAGVDLIVSDIDHEKIHQTCVKFGAIAASPEMFYDTECDILAPCALGGTLNPLTISKLKCKAIAGSANNQLLTDEDGERLLKKGILYAPDYIINSGGIINVSIEFDKDGYNPKKSRDRVSKIQNTLDEVFLAAKKTGKPTNIIANELAEYKLKHQIGKRDHPLVFH